MAAMEQAQLDLPISGHDPPGRLAVWLMACPDGDEASAVAEIRQSRTLFLDSLTGAPAVGKDDLLLIRNGRTGAFETFGPRRTDALWRDVLARLDRGEVPGEVEVGHGRVVNLVALCFGAEGYPDVRPAADGTGLERLLSTVRHEHLQGAHDARLDRVIGAREALGGCADRGLLGVLDREAADAARMLFPPSSPDLRLRVRDLHHRAGHELRRRGLSVQASQTEDLFLSWAGPDQLTLDLQDAAPPAAPDRAAPDRLAYRTHRLVAHKFLVPAPGPAGPGTPIMQRRSLPPTTFSDALLCRWLKGVGSRRLRPWHRWSESGWRWRLDICLDSDISVLFGLAGRTGDKPGRYTLRAWGRGCEVTPERSEYPVGRLASLVVSGGDGASSSVDLELTMGGGSRLPMRLAVPVDAIHRPPSPVAF